MKVWKTHIDKISEKSAGIINTLYSKSAVSLIKSGISHSNAKDLCLISQTHSKNVRHFTDKYSACHRHPAVFIRFRTGFFNTRLNLSHTNLTQLLEDTEEQHILCDCILSMPFFFTIPWWLNKPDIIFYFLVQLLYYTILFAFSLWMHSEKGLTKRQCFFNAFSMLLIITIIIISVLSTAL